MIERPESRKDVRFSSFYAFSICFCFFFSFFDFQERIAVEQARVQELERVLQTAVEQGTKLPCELRLAGAEFTLARSELLYELPVREAPRVLQERVDAGCFRAAQLDTLAAQLQAAAPGPRVPVGQMVTMLGQLVADPLWRATAARPWTAADAAQVQRLVAQLSPDGQWVSWRAVVLSLASIPEPTPAQLFDLHACLTAGASEGRVSSARLLETSFWFEPWNVPAQTDLPGDPPSFPRGRALKQLLVRMFAHDDGAIDLADLTLHLCRLSPTAGPQSGKKYK